MTLYGPKWAPNVPRWTPVETLMDSRKTPDGHPMDPQWNPNGTPKDPSCQRTKEFSLV